MNSLNLLFVLPDKNNEKVLVVKEVASGYVVPTFNQPVDANAGFANPDTFNKYFYEMTGIAVYRKYEFTHDNYCVFVLEQSKKTMQLNNDCLWISYGDIILRTNTTISDILLAVKDNYNKSINMPWVKDGFAPYIEWLYKTAAAQNFKITAEIRQIKNTYGSNVFEIPTDRGNLYQKIPCMVYITELHFTKELMKWNIAKLPKWLDYDDKLNVILMSDMGGHNLPEYSDISVLKEVIRQYSDIQKNSIKHIQKSSALFKDIRIKTIISEMDLLPSKIGGVLSGTAYQPSKAEIEKFKYNIMRAKLLLQSLNIANIPDVIDHGDLRHGNIRVLSAGYIFYDWAWSAISHPFISISLFLHVIRRTLPEDIPAKDILIDYYLNEWTDCGSFEQNKEDFVTLDKLKELFMLYGDFEWVRDILNAGGENRTDDKSADGLLLSRRYYYFCRVLKRFIETDI